MRGPYTCAEKPSADFWREFYSKIHFSKFEKMIADFDNLYLPPTIAFYSGENIVQRIAERLGATRVQENPAWTIRGKFGDVSGPEWHNIAHAPKPEEVERQIRILWKYRLA